MTVHKSNPSAARVTSSWVAILMLGACGSSGPEQAANQQAASGVTLELPAAEPYRKVSVPEAPAPAAAEAPATADVADAPPAESQAKAEPEAAEKPAPEKKAADKADDKERSAPSERTAPTEEKTTAKAKGDSDAVTTRAGRPPLGDAEIARTIDRIGFPCGRVVSSEAVASAQGIYKINCSSGESYQGTTKQGHLFFRPWTGKLERD